MGSRGIFLLLWLLLFSAELLLVAGLGKRRCTLPRKQGPCHGHENRYYYNQTHNRCLPFLYGGCRGNANQFRTAEACQRVCMKKGRCNLPPEQGPCKASHVKYYYDQTHKKCLDFVYGGCHGNGNQFNSVKKWKSGYCPAFSAGLYQPPCSVECEADSECEGAMKCCEFACRHSCTPPSRDKPGICPSPLMKKLYVPAPCVTTCAADEECSGAQKCCESPCGRTCRLPLPEKPGRCPKRQPQKSAGPSADTCLHDQECSGAEKCCFTGSSMNCLQIQPGSGAGTEGSRPGQEAARARLWALAGRGVAQRPKNNPSPCACGGK